MRSLYDKLRDRNGFIVIPCKRTVVVERLGGHGICDFCGETDSDGFLVPAMGSKWQCTECHKDWEKRAVYYKEDADYETAVTKDLMRRIALPFRHT